MLSLIRGLFKKKQAAAAREFSLSQLEQFLGEKEENLKKELRSILREADDGIKEAAEALNEAIETLKAANLQNPNIPAKAHHFMQGNRESYVKLATLFLRDVTQKGLESMSYSEVKEYAIEFKRHLEGFLQSSLRNYQVLQHFFAHESQAVAKGIKGMENAIRKMEDAICSAGLDAVSKAKEDCNAIRLKLSRMKELEQQMEKERAEQEKIGRSIKDAQDRLESVYQGEEHRALTAQKEGLRGVEEDIMLAERQFSIRFSALEKALRKFAKLSFDNEKLISLYAQFPEKAIREDHSLAILQILAKLEQELAKGSLGLDEKRTQKSIDAVKSISLEFLDAHLKAIERLEGKSKALKEAISGSSIEGQMHKLREEIQKRATEESLSSQRLALAKGQLESISITKDKEAIESLMGSAFSEKIRLVIG